MKLGSFRFSIHPDTKMSKNDLKLGNIIKIPVKHILQIMTKLKL